MRTAPRLAACVSYRYVPPGQPVAQAATFIGDVLLQFTLTFRGSLTLECPPADDGQPAIAVHDAGAALHDLADGLFITYARVDQPRIESRAGHRFRHRAACSAGPRSRRFTGTCEVRLPGAATPTATLDYLLELDARAASDPPAGPGGWQARYDESLASIGALVLEPLPIAAAHAARLHAD